MLWLARLRAESCDAVDSMELRRRVRLLGRLLLSPPASAPMPEPGVETLVWLIWDAMLPLRIPVTRPVIEERRRTRRRGTAASV